MTGPDGGDGGGSVSAPTVRMTPSDLSVDVDGTASLSLEIKTEDGELLDRDGEWTVKDPSIVEVRGDGPQRQVTGLAEGHTQVIGTVDGVADTADVDVSRDAPTVSSVELSASDLTVEVGAAAEVSVTVTSANGATLDREGTWEIADTTVAALGGVGATRQVDGVATGSTRMIATVEGVADTASVDVIEATDPSGAEPAVVFDPDKYSSTEELKDDPYGVFSKDEIGGNYNLDTTVGYPGGSQSMRYDYVDQGAGNVIGIGRRIPLENRTGELWVEFDVRWSSNYMCCIDMSKTETYAHKFLFGEVKTNNTKPWLTSDGQGAYRWSLHWPGGGASNPPNGQLKVETPTLTSGDQIHRNIGVSGADYFDGQWHRVRVHWRHSPGAYEIWIDGEKVLDLDGFEVHPEIRLSAVLLGRNKDDGNPSGTESLWWGKMTVWTQDPGW